MDQAAPPPGLEPEDLTAEELLGLHEDLDPGPESPGYRRRWDRWQKFVRELSATPDEVHRAHRVNAYIYATFAPPREDAGGAVVLGGPPPRGPHSSASTAAAAERPPGDGDPGDPAPPDATDLQVAGRVVRGSSTVVEAAVHTTAAREPDPAETVVAGRASSSGRTRAVIAAGVAAVVVAGGVAIAVSQSSRSTNPERAAKTVSAANGLSTGPAGVQASLPAGAGACSGDDVQSLNLSGAVVGAATRACSGPATTCRRIPPPRGAVLFNRTDTLDLLLAGQHYHLTVIGAGTSFSYSTSLPNRAIVTLQSTAPPVVWTSQRGTGTVTFTDSGGKLDVSLPSTNGTSVNIAGSWTSTPTPCATA